jgi:hypothetical protein
MDTFQVTSVLLDGRRGLTVQSGAASPGHYTDWRHHPLVAANAVVPVFPGETTLNAGSTAALPGRAGACGSSCSRAGSAQSWATPRCF